MIILRDGLTIEKGQNIMEENTMTKLHSDNKRKDKEVSFAAMKENINPNPDGSPIKMDTPETKESHVNNADPDGNPGQAKDKFRWKATKGLPGHILVVHLRVPFSQVEYYSF